MNPKTMRKPLATTTSLILALLIAGPGLAQSEPPEPPEPAGAPGKQAREDKFAGSNRPFARSGQEAGIVIGWNGRPAHYIYPVEFIAIDGQTINPREVMYLKPGEYEISVRGLISDAPGLRSVGRIRQPDDYNEITLVIEAGKKYSIGMKYDRGSQLYPYTTVLYKVENKGDDD